MELIKFDYSKKYQLPPLTVAMGHFDGLHIAHQKLIIKTIALAKEKNTKSAVITFDPHPDYILKKRKPTGYITPLAAKAAAIAALGIDYLIVVPFTEATSRLTATEFERRVLAAFIIRAIVTGFDYRYGYCGTGNVETLQQKYYVYVMAPIKYRNKKIGSNAIRKMLSTGDLTTVKSVLGKYYQMKGRVVSGRQIGRTFGIRTANIDISSDYQVLKKGVYAVIVTVGGRRYRGVANYGINPTIGGMAESRLEIHILNFSETIYSETVTVEFVLFIREEKKFSDLNKLAAQIKKDIEKVKKLKVDL